MIVDCYTHTWESADQLGRCIPARGWSAANPPLPGGAAGAGLSRHLSATDPVDVALVLGFKSRWLDAEVSNDHIAAYVRQHPGKLIGFAGIDPSEPAEALAELARVRETLSMPGIAVAPAAQDFHPSNSQAMQVYAEASKTGMPIIFHTGIHIATTSKLEYAQPVLLDEVAREIPDLKIVIAHMGYPWVRETVLLLAKHKNVFAEISWLTHQPWEAYQALLSAHQFGVIDKLLFGSGFPSATASQCIEDLYSINHLVHGTALPAIPREQLRGIVERDSLSLLGIAGLSSPADTDPGIASLAEAPSES